MAAPASRRPGLVVSLSPQHNVYHSGYLISAAVAAGAVFRVTSSVSPLVPICQANGVTIAVDCFDSPSTYDSNAVAECDFYLKRSYVLDAVPPDIDARRIRPFGLNYSCRTVRAIAAVVRLRLFSNLKPESIQSFLRSPAPADFEWPPGRSSDLRIIFNTRLWPADQLGPHDDPAAINGFRLELVRRLRRSFGQRFLGGIIPSPEAFEVCPELRAAPELLVNTPHRRTAYAKFSRVPAIGVYTRGLHGSNAFKLAEYLASSKCVIGESLIHQLPEPLGECHRVRNDIEGILAECDRMLTDTRLLKEIQQVSWEYYQRNIRYDRRIRLLFSSLERGSPTHTGN